MPSSVSSYRMLFVAEVGEDVGHRSPGDGSELLRRGVTPAGGRERQPHGAGRRLDGPARDQDVGVDELVGRLALEAEDGAVEQQGGQQLVGCDGDTELDEGDVLDTSIEQR